jgi:hypothetical protein
MGKVQNKLFSKYHLHPFFINTIIEHFEPKLLRVQFENGDGLRSILEAQTQFPEWNTLQDGKPYM